MATSLPLGRTSSANSLPGGVVVWEWLNEFGRWRPYEPHVANFIEKNFTGNGGHVYLGLADSSLGLYLLNFSSMCQIRSGTGTSRSVRRSVYHPLSSAGQGVAWQWEGDYAGQWHTYDLDISGVLENAFSQKHPLVDLSVAPFSLPYKINLQNMTQLRLETKRSRTIRRELLPMPYMPDNGATPESQMRGEPGHTGKGQTSNSQLPTSGGNAIAVPFKKRAVSDITGMSSHRSTTAPYSLRKKHHTQPQSSAPSLSKSASVPSQSTSTSNHVLTSGHVQHGNFSLPGNLPPSNLSLTGNLPSGSLSLPGHLPPSRLSLPGHLPPSSLSMPGHLPPSNLSLPGHLAPSSLSLSGHLPPSNLSLHGHLPPSSLSMPGHLPPSNLSLPGHLPPNSLSMPGHLPVPPRNLSLPGHLPPSTMSFGSSMLSNYSNFAALQGSLPPHLRSQLTSSHQNSSSMPVNLNTAASRLTSPTSSLQPAMSSVTNILVSPAVPSLQSMNTWPSMPTSYSVPALRGSYMSRSKSDIVGHFKGPIKIKNDTTSQRGKGTAEEVLSKYVSVIEEPPKDEDCCICCEKLSQASGYCSNGNDCVVYRLERCSHMFHKLCLHEMYECGHKDGSVQCPSCKTIYGEKCGNCPKGEMEYDTIPNHLPTYPNCGTIQIKYDIRAGIQGSEHPHPGRGFSTRGFPRYGFLPDNEDGRKVLKLLIIAWKRRLTFTIGQSTTTGEGNTVTWNEIHHKTEFGGNSSGHGYPDPNYIENVLMELAVQGVTEADLDT